MAKPAKQKAVENVEETRAVAAQETARPLAVAPGVREEVGAWGSEGLSNSDILVSKILLMQGLSDLVADGQATPGQLRDSLQGTLLGSKDKACEIIPFSSFRTWVIFEKKNGKDEYVRTVPIDASNESWPISEIINGIEVRRDKCLNFYVLRPQDITEGLAFPYLISFRRYGSQAGKKLTTFAAKLKAFNKPMASRVFELKVQTEENDKGKFFSFDIGMGRETTDAELGEAKKWYQTFKTATVRADDSDLKADVKQAPAADANQDY
jgi:hypothetical protein